MKKVGLLFAACVGLVSSALFTGCSPKVYTAQSGSTYDTGYVTFTKLLRQRMEHDNMDVKKVQFYIDHALVMRRTSGSEKGSVNGGRVEFSNGQSVNEVTIPAFTPGVCERVSGDSLFVSFDAPGNTIVFSALYANQNYTVSSPNWYYGVADVMYDGQMYKAQCADCGSAANVRLAIRKSEQNNNVANRPANITKTVVGRKVR
ncbi:MAG: hypothetical protein V4649_13455 [Bacteroidota bacterium]